MPAFKDLTGQRFGRLTVIECVQRSSRKCGPTIWKCKCDCGTLKNIQSTHLVQGATKSCGCVYKDYLSNKNRKHGMTGQRFYRIWSGMLTRVRNPKFTNYNGRGIGVCDRWLEFKNFQEDMYGEYLQHVEAHGEADTSIDRMDNDGDYCPENCEWATMAEQSINTRKNKKYVVNGESLVLAEIAEKYSIPVETIFYRIKKGWNMDMIILPAERSGVPNAAYRRELSL